MINLQNLSNRNRTGQTAMRTLLLSCVLATGLAGAAQAGEGGRDPFAVATPGVTISNPPQVADVGASAYPDMPAAYAFAPTGEPVLEANGQQGAVQTANSLPSGAMDGTVAYAQQQSVARHFAQQAARHYTAVHTVKPAG